MLSVACRQGRCNLVGPSRSLCYVASRLSSGALQVGRPVAFALPCHQSPAVEGAADRSRFRVSQSALPRPVRLPTCVRLGNTVTWSKWGCHIPLSCSSNTLRHRTGTGEGTTYRRSLDHTVQPQQRKKKHSMATRATDSNAVTRDQRTSSTTEKSRPGHRSPAHRQLGIRPEKSKKLPVVRLASPSSGHRNMDKGADSRVLPIRPLPPLPTSQLPVSATESMFYVWARAVRMRNFWCPK
ncbi:hypothetical protein B296_00033029 [Ensete ventricosum]|uniref:Uncharacterized protein n=1 Tax=Ensete ventricosum TaxID=4639 RepID=A0A426XJF4_ENSVE|nr:hypothetical protein B296_00033029 [Ensete ventricosum]